MMTQEARACPFYGHDLIRLNGAPVLMLVPGAHCALITETVANCVMKLTSEPVEWRRCPYNPQFNGAFLQAIRAEQLAAEARD